VHSLTACQTFDTVRHPCTLHCPIECSAHSVQLGLLTLEAEHEAGDSSVVRIFFLAAVGRAVTFWRFNKAAVRAVIIPILDLAAIAVDRPIQLSDYPESCCEALR